MSFHYVEKVEIDGHESRLGVGAILDDKLNEMQVHINIYGTNIYLSQEQLDEFIHALSQVDLKI